MAIALTAYTRAALANGFGKWLRQPSPCLDRQTTLCHFKADRFNRIRRKNRVTCRFIFFNQHEQDFKTVGFLCLGIRFMIESGRNSLQGCLIVFFIPYGFQRHISPHCCGRDLGARIFGMCTSKCDINRSALVSHGNIKPVRCL